MATMIEPDRPRSSTLFYFVLLSLALHIAMLMWLRGATLSLGDFEPPPLVVKLAQAPQTVAQPAAAPAAKTQAPAAARPAEQIVAPSDQENQLPPDGRAFLSDRDNRVEQESIRKGNPEAGTPQQQPPPQVASAPKPEPPPAPKPPPQPAAKAPPAKAPPAPRPEAKAPPAKQAKPAPPARKAAPTTETARGDTIPERLPGLNQLFAPPSEVLAKAEMERRAAGADAPRGGEVDDPRKDLVSAPPPAPGIFAGARGSFDYLPDVAQGNLTMLNTKADRFAPFVRRVGTRVFQNLLIFQRQNLEASDILAANDIVTARVVLDGSGKLKKLEVDEHSGSMAVDQALIDALRQAAFDDNPPKSAANANGEYEFVFQAQLIAGVGPGARGPELRTVESRLRIGLL